MLASLISALRRRLFSADAQERTVEISQKISVSDLRKACSERREALISQHHLPAVEKEKKSAHTYPRSRFATRME